MADTNWKAFERRVARSLGGKRTGAFGASISDVEGTAFSVECKRTQRVTGGIQGAWIKQARAQGRVEGRPWILVVAMVSDRTPVVVCDFAQFVEMAKRAGMIEEVEEERPETHRASRTMLPRDEETYETNFGRTMRKPAVADETVFTDAGAMTVSVDEDGNPV